MASRAAKRRTNFRPLLGFAAMFIKALYFASVAWVVIVTLVGYGEPALIAILGIPGFIGLFVTYLKTGRFLLPPK